MNLDLVLKQAVNQAIQTNAVQEQPNPNQTNDEPTQPIELVEDPDLEQKLEEFHNLIIDVNKYLLTGAAKKIHEMTTEELGNHLTEIEVYYKKCIKIKLSRSIRSFKVGLDREKFKDAQKNKKKSAASEGTGTIKKKAIKKDVGLGGLKGQDMMAFMMEQRAKMFCDTHNKMKRECGCQ